MILFVKHISIEGPGILDVFFLKKGYQTTTIDLSKGDSFPETFDDIEAVIVLGGPMNVYEEDKYPYLKDEDVFIKNILKEKYLFLEFVWAASFLLKQARLKF